MGNDNGKKRVPGQPKKCSQIFGSRACKKQKKNGSFCAEAAPQEKNNWHEEGTSE